MKLYVGNDNDVYIRGLRNASDDSYVNDAVLTFTVYDQNGNVLAGAQDIAMSYEAASNGNYRGTISGSPGTTGVTHGTEYRIVIQSSNYNIKFEKSFKAEDRAA